MGWGISADRNKCSNRNSNRDTKAEGGTVAIVIAGSLALLLTTRIVGMATFRMWEARGECTA